MSITGSVDQQSLGAESYQPFCPRTRRRYVLWSAILASSMGFIDGSVVSIAIPAIRSDLGATLPQALWISNSYMLFLSSLILIGGAVGDSFGLRRVFIFGIAVFVISSMACAIAPNPETLIVARGVQGIGAAVMVPGSLAIIAKAYPAEERGKAIGIWAAASAFTTTVGPIIGGVLLSAAGDPGWRMIFAINLPVGCAALFMLWRLVPPDSAAGARRIDMLGGSLITLALFLLAYGMTGSGGEGSIPATGQLIGFIGAGAAVLAIFIVTQARIASPMVPLRLFSITAFSGANVLTFFLYFGLSAVLFYLPMTLINGWGRSPTEAAMVFVPFGAAIALLSGWGGALADRLGPAPLIAAGSMIVAIAFGGLAVLAQYQNLWFHVFPLMALGGVGMSLVVSPLSTAVMTAVSDNDTGTASGINNAISRVAGLIAVAMMGLLASAVFDRAIENTAAAGSLGDLTFGAEFTGPDSLLAVFEQATNSAFSTVAGIVAVLSLVSGAVAWITLRHGSARDQNAP
ncbi:MFS transporter [Oricola sp.]|uniref:MFS transporter n=1 Tax=Oricola sp. TaxID=1979950 RepID=UPI003BAA4D19